MTASSRRPAHPGRAGLAAAAALASLLVWPAVVLAHATLVTSDPANGATLTASPATITASYAEPFDTARSSMALLGPDGATLATSGPIDVATAESMTISGFGTLAAGIYRVQWTTITPDDNGIERGTFTFTVAAATGSAAAPGSSGAASGGAGDVVLPLVVLVALVVVGLAWFVRRSH